MLWSPASYSNKFALSQFPPISNSSIELVGVLMTTERVETMISMLLDLSGFFASIYPGGSLKIALPSCLCLLFSV